MHLISPLTPQRISSLWVSVSLKAQQSCNVLEETEHVLASNFSGKPVLYIDAVLAWFLCVNNWGRTHFSLIHIMYEGLLPPFSHSPESCQGSCTKCWSIRNPVLVLHVTLKSSRHLYQSCRCTLLLASSYSAHWLLPFLPPLPQDSVSTQNALKFCPHIPTFLTSILCFIYP